MKTSTSFLLALGSSARVSRPLTGIADRSLWLEVEEGRENRARTHSINTNVGQSSVEEMAKLNSLSLLGCGGKLYIQLYLSNPSTQTCQAAMLLQ